MSGASVLDAKPAWGKWIVLGLALLIAGLAIIRAAWLSWLCDDAFITLRYVQQVLAGHGAVANPGEWVEGYTHPLWFALLLCGSSMGLAPDDWALGLGLLCWTMTLALLLVPVLRGWNNRAPFSALCMLPLVLASAQFDLAIWATSGMETSLLSLLWTAAALLLLAPGIVSRKRLAVLGALLFAASMTRPDAALVFLAGGLGLGFARLRQPRAELLSSLLAYGATALLVLPGYLLWKYHYYGELLPNTYYVKAATGDSWVRGLRYCWLFVRHTPHTGLAALVVLVALGRAWSRRRSRLATRPDKLECPESTRRMLVILACLLIYLGLFIVRLGGDFMHARFFVPLLIPLYVTAAQAISDAGLDSRKAWLLVLASVLLVSAEGAIRRIAFVQISPEGRQSFLRVHGVGDEWAATTMPRPEWGGLSSEQLAKHLGTTLEPVFRGTRAAIVSIGQDALAYYGKFPRSINYYGLTDAELARMPAGAPEGPVGHQKPASYAALMERGADFSFSRLKKDNKGPLGELLCRFDLLPAAQVEAWMLTWDKPLLEALKQRLGDRLLCPQVPQMAEQFKMQQLPLLSGESRKQAEGYFELLFKDR